MPLFNPINFCQHWWIVKRGHTRGQRLELLPLFSPHSSLPTYPFPCPPFPFPLSLSSPWPHLLPKSSYEVWLGEPRKLPQRVRAAKRIFVQRRPKLSIWRWVKSLAKWVNIFTNLRNLQWRTGYDPESETAMVLTDSRCALRSQGEHLTTFLDHAADQIRCVAVTSITVCGRNTFVRGSSSLTWYLKFNNLPFQAGFQRLHGLGGFEIQMRVWSTRLAWWSWQVWIKLQFSTR